MLDIGKVETVLVNAYLPDEIRMGLSEILDFLNNLTVEFQINQIGLRVTVNGHRLLEMSQCLGIKSYIHRSFRSRGNRCFSPLGYRAGTIRFDLCKH